MDLIRSHVMVCGGTNCSSSASGEIIREFERQIAEKGLEKEIKVVRTGCFGMCEAGPVVIVYPEGAFYARMTVENVTRIVDEHLVKGRVVKELLYKEAVDEDNKVKSLDSVDFYKKQRRVALRNCVLWIYFFASFGLLAPYLERACLLLATPAVSSVPLTMWYLVPGRSFTLPPRIRTTLCS